MSIVTKAVEQVKSWFSAKDELTRELTRGEDYSPNTRQNRFSVNGYDNLTHDLRLNGSLMQRYSDYEEMDDYPEIASAMDIYADDATVFSYSEGKTVWAVSKNRRVKQALDDLLINRISIDNDIYSLARTLIKYGNCFSEILANDTGIVGLNFMPPPTVRRVETRKGSLVAFVQDAKGSFSVSVEGVKKAIEEGNLSPKGSSMTIFEPWEVVHWRLQGKNMASEYGFSMLEPARWVWRRLVMAEDSALVYKLTRAPARFAFYVDVGDMPPSQAVQYVNQVKQQFKKKKLFNGSTGKLDFKVNPLGPDEDFWIPTRGGQESTRIDVISGPDSQSVTDLEYFRNKLFAALKVPKSYLGGEGAINRTSLAQEDVRFARTVMRVQREIRNGVKQLCRLHLALLGIDPDKVTFEIKMTPPSAIFELAQLELRNAQSDTASRLQDFFAKDYILQTVFDYSKEEAEAAIMNKQDEQKAEVRFTFETQAELERQFPNVDSDELMTIDKVKEMSYPSYESVGSLKQRLARLESELKDRVDLEDRVSLLEHRANRGKST